MSLAEKDRAEPARPVDGADVSSRLASGPFVVLATVDDDGGKAVVTVERVYRGENIGGAIRIDARQANATRILGDPPFRVREQERAIFVLSLAVDLSGDPLGADIYQPSAGYRSKIPIPVEGGPALLEAVERVIYYQDTPDRGAAEADLVDWLGGRNPWLVDFAVHQAAKFGLAGPAWIPGLLALTQDVSPWRRIKALQALGESLEKGRLRGRSQFRRVSPLAEDETNDLLRASHEAIIRLARSDPDAEVRTAAVREVQESGYEKAAEVLEAISREDPSQDVRYEAAAGLRRVLDGGTR